MELFALLLWFMMDCRALAWERHSSSLSFKFMMRLIGNQKMLKCGILNMTLLPYHKCECM